MKLNREQLKTQIHIGIFTFKNDRSSLLIKELKKEYENDGNGCNKYDITLLI